MNQNINVTYSYSFGAAVPGCWVVAGLLCASGSAIPPVGVWALLSLSSRTPLGLLKVSSRFMVDWILSAVWLSSVVFSLNIISKRWIFSSQLFYLLSKG